VSEADDVLPAGPGLPRRWLVAAPCVIAGAVLPMVIANVLAIWQNWATRTVSLAEVRHDFAYGIAIWTEIASVFGVAALIANRFEVTKWPAIIVRTMTPTLLAFAIIGPASSSASRTYHQPLFLLDIPGAVALGMAGYLLVRFGVRQLAEPAAWDNIDSRLDVRVPRHRGGSVLLRHDRLFIIGKDGRRTVRRGYSWLDFRFVPGKLTDESELEVVVDGERYAFPVDPLEAPVIRAAIRGRAHFVRTDPLFQRKQNAHRRSHPGRYRSSRTIVDALTSQEHSSNPTIPGFMFLVKILMFVGPVGAVVLTIAATQESPDKRSQLIVAIVADIVLGLAAHLKFWRLRAARRYLETHSNS
jgi:hypothetical protein